MPPPAQGVSFQLLNVRVSCPLAVKTCMTPLFVRHDDCMVPGIYCCCTLYKYTSYCVNVKTHAAVAGCYHTRASNHWLSICMGTLALAFFTFFSFRSSNPLRTHHIRSIRQHVDFGFGVRAEDDSCTTTLIRVLRII